MKQVAFISFGIFKELHSMWEITGKPFFEVLEGVNAAETSQREVGAIHLSLSHEEDHSIAFVVVEMAPVTKK